MDSAHWNPLVVRTLAAIRATNPARTVVVGPVNWNGIGALKDLVLPGDDRNLVVTIHYYDPMHFTHQGASWVGGSTAWLGTQWHGTDAEKQIVVNDFAKAADWGKAHGRPVYLGEFGSYSKGDIDSRVRWTTCVRSTADADGFAWTYWEFNQGFGVYDPVAGQWRQRLLDALAPKP
jgi:endoglucanase